MTKIVARGTPLKYPYFGEITITVTGDEISIHNIDIATDGTFHKEIVERMLNEDMKKGPRYPLCAEPETMRCVLFILYEWFGENKSVWINEPEHVQIVEGEVEPMESVPGRIY